MAIDPKKYGKFRDEIDKFVKIVIEEENLAKSVPEAVDISQEVLENYIHPFLDEHDDILRGVRPPRLYIFGSAGVGKSSVINALANKDVASVGNIKPTTLNSKLYNISFPERYSSWEVVDSRGLFESMSPDGELPEDTIQFMQDDIEEYRPDVMLHIISPEQVRSGNNEFKEIKKLQKELENAPPILTVLNKVDIHMSPGDDWPPENNLDLSSDIQRNIEFVSEVVSDVLLEDDFDVTPFDKNNPVRGLQFDSKEFIGVIPVYGKQEPYWNIDTLSILIGDYLPDDSRLQFFQAQERVSIMRNIASEITWKSSKTAAGIGAAPAPYADIIPLTVLQYVQVALIGGLSCREMKMKTVGEFLGSMGIVAGSAFAFRKVARGMVQLVPFGGQAVSGAMAGAGTYAMGKAAEKYFFEDIIEEPDTFMHQGEDLFKDF